MADSATDPTAKAQYLRVAENYLRVAQFEESLAIDLEKLGPLLPNHPSENP